MHALPSDCPWLNNHDGLCCKYVMYEAYTESKYRFVVKNNRVRFHIKFYCCKIQLFFYISAAITGAQVFVYPPHRMQPPAMLATTDNVIE